VGKVNHLTELPGFDEAVASRRSLVQYPEDDQESVADAERMEYWDELAALYVPVVAGDEVLGVLELTEKRERRSFSDEDLRLVEQMADVAAIALRAARQSRDVHEQNRRLSALLEAGATLAATTELDEVLPLVARLAAEALQSSCAYIYQYDPSLDALIWCGTYQRADVELAEEPFGTVYPLDDYAYDRRSLESNQVLQASIDDPELDEASRANLIEFDETALLTVPLRFGNEIVGMLEVAEVDRPRRFSEAEMDFALLLGERAAAAIHNAEMIRRLQRQNEQMQALLSSSRAMTSSLVAEEVLDLVCREAARALGAPSSYIYRYDAGRRTLTWLAQYQQRPRAFEGEDIGTVYPLDQYAQDHEVIETLRPVQRAVDDEDLAPEQREFMAGWGDVAALMVPLVVGDEIVGILEVAETERTRRYTDDEVALAQTIGEHAAVALRNAELFRRLQRQNEQMQALLTSSRVISSTVVVDEVLERVGEQAAKALDAPSCYIYEYDQLNDRIIWRSHYQADTSYGTEDPVGTSYPLDEFPWDRAVLRSGQPSHVTLDDEGLDPDLRRNMREWREQTLLTVPLVFQGDPVGLMEIAETALPRRFTEEEVDLARAIGEQAATAIRNAQLFRRETWRNERLVRVLEISRAVGSSLDAGEVAEGLQAQVGRLFVEHPAAVSVRLLARDEAREGVALPDDVDSLVMAAIEQRGALQAASGEAHRLVMPLIQKDQPVGYLEIVGGGPGGFERDEVELVQLLANQAAASVDNARLYETIERQAMTDGLTGLYNHRHFFQALRSEVARARRYGFSLSVLMLDLDDFKSFNDRFGHPAGDRVLRAVSDILRAQVRQDIDVPARYGGEEFAVILPHTPWDGAKVVGERLGGKVADIEDKERFDGARLTGERVRRNIAEAPLPLLDGGKPAHVTVSVGVATLPAHAADADELVSKADQALYRAKQQGKDRVVVYE
jgi:diguanylate cyclase (GGDEF)-like protein